MTSYGVCLSVWLTLLSLVISRSVMLLPMVFLLFYGWAIFHRVYAPHLLYPSSVSGHLGYFQILAIVDGAAVNIGIHVSFLVSFCLSLHNYPGVELLDHVVALFLGFWGSSIVYKGSLTPHTCWQLLVVFLMMAILTGVVLICISLMASDAGCPFVYVLATCMSSLEKKNVHE